MRNIPWIFRLKLIGMAILVYCLVFSGAATIAVVMLAVSFLMLFVINAIQAWARRLGQ